MAEIQFYAVLSRSFLPDDFLAYPIFVSMETYCNGHRILRNHRGERKYIVMHILISRVLSVIERNCEKSATAKYCREFHAVYALLRSITLNLVVSSAILVL